MGSDAVFKTSVTRILSVVLRKFGWISQKKLEGKLEKKLPGSTISYKIFETNCSFHVKVVWRLVRQFVYTIFISNTGTFIPCSMKKSLEEHFNRSNIFLLYFYDAYDVNLWGKKSAELRLIHAEQMSLYVKIFLLVCSVLIIQ